MHVKVKEVQPTEVVIDSYYTCDRCGEKIKSTVGDAFAFNFEYRTGYGTPSGGGGEVMKLDLCQTCATVAVHLLTNAGCKFQVEDWDF